MSDVAPHSLVRILSGVPLLDDRATDELLEIVGGSANLLWEEGESIFEPGDPAEDHFVIVRGEVTVVGSDGSEQRFGPGEHVGEPAIEREVERSGTARASTDVELIVIPRETLDGRGDRQD